MASAKRWATVGAAVIASGLAGCYGDNHASTTTTMAMAMDHGSCKYLDEWTTANGQPPPASFVNGWVATFPPGPVREMVEAEIQANCPEYWPSTTTSAP